MGNRADRPLYEYSSSVDGSIEVVREFDSNFFAGIAVVVVAISGLATAVLVGRSIAAALSGGNVFPTLIEIAIPLVPVIVGVFMFQQASSGKLYELERVRVSRSALVHSYKGRGRDSTRTFAAPEINTLRWQTSMGEHSPASVEFYYGPETIRLFRGIEEAEGNKLIRKIAEQIPSAAQPYEAWRASRTQEA